MVTLHQLEESPFCDKIRRALMKPWLVGSALSLADLAVFAQIRCIDGAEEGRARIAARPAIVE